MLQGLIWIGLCEKRERERETERNAATAAAEQERGGTGLNPPGAQSSAVQCRRSVNCLNVCVCVCVRAGEKEDNRANGSSKQTVQQVLRGKTEREEGEEEEKGNSRTVKSVREDFILNVMLVPAPFSLFSCFSLSLSLSLSLSFVSCLLSKIKKN